MNLLHSTYLPGINPLLLCFPSANLSMGLYTTGVSSNPYHTKQTGNPAATIFFAGAITPTFAGLGPCAASANHGTHSQQSAKEPIIFLQKNKHHAVQSSAQLANTKCQKTQTTDEVLLQSKGS